MTAGRWYGPNDQIALSALADEGVVRELAERVLRRMEHAGVLVRQPYYVPSFDELVDVYREVSHARWRRLDGLRWVMCRETHDAMAKQYADRRYVPPPTFDAGFWRSPEGQELPTAALEADIHTVLNAARRWDDHGKLLGVPIRFDPAARSPLLEIDSLATMRMPR